MESINPGDVKPTAVDPIEQMVKLGVDEDPFSVLDTFPQKQGLTSAMEEPSEEMLSSHFLITPQPGNVLFSSATEAYESEVAMVVEERDEEKVEKEEREQQAKGEERRTRQECRFCRCQRRTGSRSREPRSGC